MLIELIFDAVSQPYELIKVFNKVRKAFITLAFRIKDPKKKTDHCCNFALHVSSYPGR